MSKIFYVFFITILFSSCLCDLKQSAKEINNTPNKSQKKPICQINCIFNSTEKIQQTTIFDSTGESTASSKCKINCSNIPLNKMNIDFYNPGETKNEIPPPHPQQIIHL